MRFLILALVLISCGRNNRNHEISTPVNLNSAITAGDYQYIINLGQNVKVQSTNSEVNPLMDLFLAYDGLESPEEEKKRLDAIEALITNQELDVNFRSHNDQSSCLSIAVLNNDIAGVELLIKHGANPDYLYGPYKRTALHLAIDRNYSEIAKKLYPVTKEDLKDKEGLTPLQFIEKKENKELLQWIKERNNLSSAQPADS